MKPERVFGPGAIHWRADKWVKEYPKTKGSFRIRYFPQGDGMITEEAWVPPSGDTRKVVTDHRTGEMTEYFVPLSEYGMEARAPITVPTECFIGGSARPPSYSGYFRDTES